LKKICNNDLVTISSFGGIAMSTYAQELRPTAQARVILGQGVLAMDERNGTCNKRFEKLGIPTTEDRRWADRELILTTPNLSRFINCCYCLSIQEIGL
jgi:hypothetical protein